MESTHYMEILMLNSPWNLILFMAIPVLFAEFIAISDLFLLWSGKSGGALSKANRIASILAGPVFLAIALYLFIAFVLPVHQSGSWRTWIDVVAVYAYLICVIPLGLVSLLAAGVLFKNRAKEKRTGLHLAFVTAFLVFSHVAMIFGMVDPSIARDKVPALNPHHQTEIPMQMDHSAHQMEMDHSMHHHMHGNP